jgi:proteasome lid subunit RPN8/RPN11
VRRAGRPGRERPPGAVHRHDERRTVPEPVVIYHSHTATEAYPSRTDISYASEPHAHYVLVSTREENATEFRSYRIVDGVVTEEPVSVVE